MIVPVPEEGKACQFCGTMHKALCARIKSIHFDTFGLPGSIDFHRPDDLPTSFDHSETHGKRP